MHYETSLHARQALIGSLLVLAASVTVSSKAIMVKLAYAYGVDAETLLALRMAFSMPFFAGLALWAHWAKPRPAVTAHDAWAIFVLGVLGGYAPMWFDFAGLAYVSAGLERIILFLYPTMVVLISAVLFKRRIGRREVFALAASYVGVGLAVGHDLTVLKSGMGDTLLGALLVAISALIYAAYLVYSGRLLPRIGTARFTAYTMLTAGVASGVHFAVTPHRIAVTQLPMPVYELALLMAVVATVLPAVMLNAGIHRLGSSRASLVSSVGPVSTILLASVFLGEAITAMQLLGTALVLLGVLVISIYKADAAAIAR
ncbi:MAG TPA: DMT family transporter [Methylophilaceae bacterium]|nr:DMT family transporter [Methylophilaceae bacterium]